MSKLKTSFARAAFVSIAALTAAQLIISCTSKTRNTGTDPVVNPVGTDPSPVQEPICDRSKQDGGFQYPDLNLPVAGNEIKIMAYNAENLFNTTHDENHGDWAYLPKDHPLKENCKGESNDHYIKQCYDTDWNDTVLDIKLEQLADVVRVQGETPDLLGLEEVENADVVGRLAAKLGYKKIVITTGSDRRGINNAIVYKEEKLSFLESREVVVGGELNKHTRNILGAYFRPRINKSKPKDVIGFYVNHWPSQSNPAVDRVLAAATLKKMIEDDRTRFGKQGLELFPVAVGDFNTVEADKPHPFDEVVVSKEWEGHLVSVNAAFEALEIPKTSPLCVLTQNMPKGTYYYKKAVQTLDYVFVGQNMTDGEGVEVDVESFRIIAGPNASELVTKKLKAEDGAETAYKFLIPLRMDVKATAPGPGVGAADHFPIAVRVKLN